MLHTHTPSIVLGLTALMWTSPINVVPPGEAGPGFSPPRTLPAGTMLEVRAAHAISSRTNRAGDRVTATAVIDVRDADGQIVIPAGALLEGIIEDIKPAPNPGSRGSLSLVFHHLSFGQQSYSVLARSVALGTHEQGRGVTGGDVAKVGVGAAGGAVLGRVIGGNATGTVVGGLLGAATGAAVASAAKDHDIVLPANAHVSLVLQAPLTVEVAGDESAGPEVSASRAKSRKKVYPPY